MIPSTTDAWQTPAWRRELARGVRDARELLHLLELPASLAGEDAARDFALRVPRPFVSRMRRGDPDDPLLRQVLPLTVEVEAAPGFGLDPVGDLAARSAPGVLHKYQGRALLLATGACAVHCRYCFRRHFPYGEAAATPARWDTALDYLRRDASVREVILSGGDPLMLDDERLGALAEALARIPHVRCLRIHTRLPVVLPSRVDDALLGWLAGARLRVVVVIHANHANELDPAVGAAMQRLRQADAQLLNQSVLLRGVNDSAEALVGLSEALFEAGVLPYYLHMLDRVQGAAHFEVPDARARELRERLSATLPGYLVPRFVRECAGAPAKMPLE